MLHRNRFAITTTMCNSLKVLAFIVAGTACSLADDRLRLRDVSRLKGQETNKIQGMGLVVGLNGTGDSAIKPTTRMLARMLQNMGASIGSDAQGIPDPAEIEKAGNVALVMITVDVPATGAQQGDLLNCNVSALGATSLRGGQLMLAYLLGPRADDPRVYGIANGQISIPDESAPTGGVIFNGCKMEASIQNQFVQDGKMTIILDKDIASFSTAIDIKDSIDGLNRSGLSAGNGASDTLVIAHAIDQSHIEVSVPIAYKDEPVKFAALVLDIELPHIKKTRRVVLNEREGVIVIGEDILINAVAITHKNLSIEARLSRSGFVGVDINTPEETRPKLKNLVEALNALNVPTQDVIAIIRTLKENGDLYGEVVLH